MEERSCADASVCLRWRSSRLLSSTASPAESPLTFECPTSETAALILRPSGKGTDCHNKGVE
eukprot:6201896-Pleurochrysis_carterae.AAC.3